MAIGDKKSVVMESDRAVNGGIATLDSKGNVPFEQLGNVVRPNLLDNWYFGNPVDQRGGYIFPIGTPYLTTPTPVSSGGVIEGYLDAACDVKTLAMESPNWYKIVLNETTYYLRAQDKVRGYTDYGYTIDRWYGTDDSTVVIGDKGLKIYPTNTIRAQLYSVYRNPEQLHGKTVTQSVLLNGNIYSVTKKLPTAPLIDTTTTITDGISLYIYQNALNTNLSAGIRVEIGYSIENLMAMKLEFGSEQTLAHQDKDGKWVLNEIPNYSEELDKCLWHYEQSVWSSHYGSPDNANYINYPNSHFYKHTKRVAPKISVNPNPTQPLHVWQVSNGSRVNDAQLVEPIAYNTGMLAPRIYSPSGAFVVGQMYGFYIGDNAYFISSDS